MSNLVFSFIRLLGKIHLFNISMFLIANISKSIYTIIKYITPCKVENDLLKIQYCPQFSISVLILHIFTWYIII